MHINLKSFLLILLIAFTTACTKAPVSGSVDGNDLLAANGTSIAAVMPKEETAVQWGSTPSTLVVRAYTGPAIGITYDINYFIPEAQIWGDGRIVWVESGPPRRVLMAQLTTNQMEALMQEIVEVGFFDWEDSYGIGGSTHHPWHLSVNLIGRRKEVVAYKGFGPDAYYELVELLRRGAGTEARDFLPTEGYLTANCWPLSDGGINPLIEWPDNIAGFTLDQVGNGRFIEGDSLSFAWQTINQNPTSPIFVKSNDHSCAIMVQLPGVSFYEPP